MAQLLPPSESSPIPATEGDRLFSSSRALQLRALTSLGKMEREIKRK